MRALLVALLLLPLPLAMADGCARDVGVYAKRAPLPAAEDPTAGVTAGACARVAGQTVGDVRYLMPLATEVTVVVHRDYGAGVPNVTVTLDGLGFANDAFLLARTQTLRDVYAYRMPFVPIPDGPGRGELRVNVTLPDGWIEKTYVSPV